jgi:AbrB family looped-hinge helix DNA binding protein
MRVTTKGQVTIPIEIREKLGIFPGTEVEFILRNDSATLKKRKTNKKGYMSRGARAVALLAGSATDKRLTTDEILALTRGTD